MSFSSTELARVPLPSFVLSSLFSPPSWCLFSPPFRYVMWWAFPFDSVSSIYPPLLHCCRDHASGFLCAFLALTRSIAFLPLTFSLSRGGSLDRPFPRQLFSPFLLLKPSANSSIIWFISRMPPTFFASAATILPLTGTKPLCHFVRALVSFLFTYQLFSVHNPTRARLWLLEGMIPRSLDNPRPVYCVSRKSVYCHPLPPPACFISLLIPNVFFFFSLFSSIITTLPQFRVTRYLSPCPKFNRYKVLFFAWMSRAFRFLCLSDPLAPFVLNFACCNSPSQNSHSFWATLSSPIVHMSFPLPVSLLVHTSVETI